MEVWSVGIKPEFESQVPYLNRLRWYIFIIGAFYMGDGAVMMDLIVISNNWILLTLFDNHLLYSFILCLIGLIYFVVKLNQHTHQQDKFSVELLHYQYGQLAWNLTNMLVMWSIAPIIRVPFFGIIWAILPMSTVVANDVFAYGFGKLFGKHPLTQLSPKKTWEGYIFSAIATIPFGYWLANFLMKYDALLCPSDKLEFGFVECQRNEMYIGREYSLFGTNIMMEPFQIYNAIISIWIAIICPIGGFLASGYKRAFELENYGSIIPGHGGVTDRMDAEILMCCFVYFVYKIIETNHYSSENLMGDIETAASKLTDTDLDLLIEVLENLVN